MAESRPYLVLARKYRPVSFADVVGQGPAATTLQHAIEEGRVAHAYLFCGSRGIGKTSMARILARALNCLRATAPTSSPCNECELCRAVAAGQDMDVIEIDGASNNGVEEVRQLRENARYRPSRARFKIYIIDEVHMLSTAAFNALLKTLEEPPAHVKFILATTQPEKLPEDHPLEVSKIDFRRIPESEIASRLTAISKQEGIGLEPEAAFLVAKAARGSLRDALTLLDRIAAGSSSAISRGAVESALGFVPRARLFDLTDRLGDKDGAGALAILDEVYRSGRDLDEFARTIVDHLRALLIARTCGADKLPDETEEDRRRIAEQAKRFSAEALLAMLQVTSDAVRRSKRLDLGRVHLEMALLELARISDLVAVPDLLRQIEGLRRGESAASERGLGPVSAPSARADRASESRPRPSASSGDAEPLAPRAMSGSRAPASPTPSLGDPAPASAPETTSTESSVAVLPITGHEARESANVSTVDEVASMWPVIVERVRARKMSLAMLLSQTVPVELLGDELRLGFRKELASLARHLENVESRSLVEECVQEVVGARLRVVGTMLGPEFVVPPSRGADSTVAGARSSRTRTASESGESPQASSPAVKRAIEIFEGRIVGRER